MTRATAGRRTRVLLVGVGGQGVVTAAEVLGLAAQDASLHVTIGQLHGMAQRGGSVEGAVVIGPGETAFIGPAEADFVVGFEPLETLRVLPRMHAATVVLVNTGRIAPFALARSGRAYPALAEIVAPLRAVTLHVQEIDGPTIVEQTGEQRTLNMGLLGALVGLGALPFGLASLERAITERYADGFRAANLHAARLGAAGAQRMVES